MVDAEDSRQPAPDTANSIHLSIRPTSLETAILRVVKDDPFASINEIRLDIADIDPEFEVGWWRVFSFLRKRQLLTRRSRFRLARGR